MGNEVSSQRGNSPESENGSLAPKRWTAGQGLAAGFERHVPTNSDKQTVDDILIRVVKVEKAEDRKSVV